MIGPVGAAVGHGLNVAMSDRPIGKGSRESILYGVDSLAHRVGCLGSGGLGGGDAIMLGYRGRVHGHRMVLAVMMGSTNAHLRVTVLRGQTASSIGGFPS